MHVQTLLILIRYKIASGFFLCLKLDFQNDKHIAYKSINDFLENMAMCYEGNCNMRVHVYSRGLWLLSRMYKSGIALD